MNDIAGIFSSLLVEEKAKATPDSDVVLFDRITLPKIFQQGNNDNLITHLR